MQYLDKFNDLTFSLQESMSEVPGQVNTPPLRHLHHVTYEVMLSENNKHTNTFKFTPTTNKNNQKNVDPKSKRETESTKPHESKEAKFPLLKPSNHQTPSLQPTSYTHTPFFPFSPFSLLPSSPFSPLPRRPQPPHLPPSRPKKRNPFIHLNRQKTHRKPPTRSIRKVQRKLILQLTRCSPTNSTEIEF